jgi:hypothetical protein
MTSVVYKSFRAALNSIQSVRMSSQSSLIYFHSIALGILLSNDLFTINLPIKFVNKILVIVPRSNASNGLTKDVN